LLSSLSKSTVPLVMLAAMMDVEALSCKHAWPAGHYSAPIDTRALEVS
jgi:hypothetical protein